MTNSKLTKEDASTEHELGSIRDGSAKNEGMKPTKESTVDPTKVPFKTPEKKAQDPDYPIEEGQKTAKKNHDEEQTVQSANSPAENDFDPIKAGQETARRNIAAEKSQANSNTKVSNKDK